MKTRVLIVLGIILAATTMTAFFIFPGVSHFVLGNDTLTNQNLDVHLNVTGIKSHYEIGEPIAFSVQVKSLGKTVPWPQYRIYQDYVDISSEPVYSRMYMTPIEPEDRQNSFEWREKTWNFPLEDDDPIRFSDKGNYTLRVDVDAKKHALVDFQIVDYKNPERDAKLDAGYKLYPGVGWVPPDELENQQPLYRVNPDNPGELILDVDAMQQVQEILDYCGPPKYQGFAYGLEYSNGTHVIDNNSCEWRKIK